MKLKICENLRTASFDPKFTDSHKKNSVLALLGPTFDDLKSKCSFQCKFTRLKGTYFA